MSNIRRILVCGGAAPPPAEDLAQVAAIRDCTNASGHYPALPAKPLRSRRPFYSELPKFQRRHQ